jgi:hypothetical protein
LWLQFACKEKYILHLDTLHNLWQCGSQSLLFKKFGKDLRIEIAIGLVMSRRQYLHSSRKVPEGGLPESTMFGMTTSNAG